MSSFYLVSHDAVFSFPQHSKFVTSFTVPHAYFTSIPLDTLQMKFGNKGVRSKATLGGMALHNELVIVCLCNKFEYFFFTLQMEIF